MEVLQLRPVERLLRGQHQRSRGAVERTGTGRLTGEKYSLLKGFNRLHARKAERPCALFHLARVVMRISELSADSRVYTTLAPSASEMKRRLTNVFPFCATGASDSSRFSPLT